MDICHQCYLPILGQGVQSTINNKKHLFCCSGCLFVFKLLGDNEEQTEYMWILAKLSLALFLAMNIMIFSLVLYAGYFNDLPKNLVTDIRYLLLFLSTPVMFLLGFPLIKNILSAKKNLNLSVDFLIFISCFFAYLFSVISTLTKRGEVYFDTATMVLVFFTLGKLCEAFAKAKTYKELKNYKKLVPDEVVKVNSKGEEVKVLTENIVRGEVIKIIPGEVVAVDSKILSGEGFFNENILTGEEKLVFKKNPDVALQGAINYDGVFLLQVLKPSSQSFVANMKDRVENLLIESKFLNLANQISQYFIPLVLILFFLAIVKNYFFTNNIIISLNFSLSVLVVACPCALGIATPLVLFSSSIKLINSGIFIKDINVLEKLAKIKKIFLDKTGTLTTTDFNLHFKILNKEIDYLELLQYVASLEQYSSHLIAKAIIKNCQENNLKFLPVKNYKLHLGEGIEGEIADKKIFVGSEFFFKNNNFDFFKVKKNNDFNVLIGWGSEIKATLTLKEVLRDEAQTALNAFNKLNIKTAILSGDKKEEVQRIAEKLSIKEYYFGCNPEKKGELLKKENLVAFAGDGINDAISLATSFVGISFSSGVEINKQAAKIIITNAKLTSIPYIIKLARYSFKLMKQNLFWAFFYNIFALTFAFLGFLKPIFAAFLMVLSSLFLIYNSLKPLYFKKIC